MPDDNKDLNTNAKDNNTQDIDYKSEFEKLKTDYEKTRNENAAFFQDMKAWKEKAREFEEALKNTGKEKDKFKNDAERLESLKNEIAEKEKGWQAKEQQYNQERLNIKALKLANELEPLNADAAEMLAEQILKRLKMTEDGVAILDKDGKVSNFKDDDLKEEFKATERYKLFMKGRDSSGSGAKGGLNGSGTAIDQSKMSATDKLTQYYKSAANKT